MQPPPVPIRIADQAAARLLFAGLATARREMAAAAFLDPEWRLLALRHWTGASDRITLPLRRLVSDALHWQAAGIVIAHNHPGGDPQPSEADRRSTRRLVRGFELLDIAVFDHLIFAGGRVVSMRGAGLL